MKTVILSEEVAPRHYRVTMYAGDIQRIEFILREAPTSVVWTQSGGEVQSSGVDARTAYAVYKLNSEGGDGGLQANTTYADGTQRKIILEVEAMGAL